MSTEAKDTFQKTKYHFKQTKQMKVTITKYLENKSILRLKFLKVVFTLILRTVYVVPLDFPPKK